MEPNGYNCIKTQPNECESKNKVLKTQSCFSKEFILNKYFRNTGKHNTNYENLCQSCGYGLFDAHGTLCNFCECVVNGVQQKEQFNQLQHTTSAHNGNSVHIYENVCATCLCIYSGEKCDNCFYKTPATVPNSNDSKIAIRKSKSGRTLLSALIDSLKRTRLIYSSQQSIATRPFEIVHNVEGFDNVFRTQETFDLKRICELKRIQNSCNDMHIYGRLKNIIDSKNANISTTKLSQSHDQLLASSTAANCSPIAASETSFDAADYHIRKHKRFSNDHLESTRLEDFDNPTYTVKKQSLYLVDSICQWMRLLRYETHSYRSFGLAINDEHITFSDVKSIPAKNFLIYCSTEFNSLGTSGISFKNREKFDSADVNVSCNKNEMIEYLIPTTHMNKDDDIAQANMIYKFLCDLKGMQKGSCAPVSTNREIICKTNVFAEDRNVEVNIQTDVKNYEILTMQHNDPSSEFLNQQSLILKTLHEYEPNEFFQQNKKIQSNLHKDDSHYFKDMDKKNPSFSSEPINENSIECAGPLSNNCEYYITFFENVYSNKFHIKCFAEKTITDILCSSLASASFNKAVIFYPNSLKTFLQYTIYGTNSIKYKNWSLAQRIAKYRQIIICLTKNEDEKYKLPCRQLLNLSSKLYRVSEPLSTVKIGVKDGSVIDLNVDTPEKKVKATETFHVVGAKKEIPYFPNTQNFIGNKNEFIKYANPLQIPACDPKTIFSTTPPANWAFKYNNNIISSGRRDYDEEKHNNDNENIYQPIWKFKTMEKVQQDNLTNEGYNSLGCTLEETIVPNKSNELTSVLPKFVISSHIEDNDEWETDEDFIFVKDSCYDSEKNKLYKFNSSTLSSSCSSDSVSGSTVTDFDSSTITLYSAISNNSTQSHFRNICIFYCEKVPNIRAIVYEYNRLTAWVDFVNKFKNHFYSPYNTYVKAETNLRIERDDNPYNVYHIHKTKKGKLLDNSVEAWKNLLLDVNYFEDEEELFIPCELSF